MCQLPYFSFPHFSCFCEDNYRNGQVEKAVFVCLKGVATHNFDQFQSNLGKKCKKWEKFAVAYKHRTKENVAVLICTICNMNQSSLESVWKIRKKSLNLNPTVCPRLLFNPLTVMKVYAITRKNCSKCFHFPTP